MMRTHEEGPRRVRWKLVGPVLTAMLTTAVLGIAPGAGHATSGGTVTGFVQDSHGFAVNGICLDVVNPGKKNTANDVVVTTAPSGTDGTPGHINQDLVPPGTYVGYFYNCGALGSYVARYTGDTHDKSKASTFTVTDGGTVDLGHQIIQLGGSVDGNLLDGSHPGTGAPNVAAWAWTIKGGLLLERTCTDAGGHYGLFNLPGEGVKLEFSAKNSGCPNDGTFADTWFGGAKYGSSSIVNVPVGGDTTVPDQTLTLVQNKKVSITSVTFAGDSTNPTITVNGSGFGKKTPKPDPTSRPCGEPDDPSYGFDYGNNVVLWDMSSADQWQAGFPGDCIGLNFVSYTPTQIVFTLGQWYRDVQVGRQPLSVGDPFVIHVKGAPITGNVTYGA